MPIASLKEKAKKQRVNFLFEAPDAKEVLLGGDSNQWNANTHPMKKDESGVWKKAVMLEPGR
jgi:1,4-alpha-glucan branching enzyme